MNFDDAKEAEPGATLVLFLLAQSWLTFSLLGFVFGVVLSCVSVDFLVLSYFGIRFSCIGNAVLCDENNNDRLVYFPRWIQPTLSERDTSFWLGSGAHLADQRESQMNQRESQTNQRESQTNQRESQMNPELKRGMHMNLQCLCPYVLLLEFHHNKHFVLGILQKRKARGGVRGKARPSNDNGQCQWKDNTRTQNRLKQRHTFAFSLKPSFSNVCVNLSTPSF